MCGGKVHVWNCYTYVVVCQVSSFCEVDAVGFKLVVIDFIDWLEICSFILFRYFFVCMNNIFSFHL